ncbi:Helix-turn-helix domain [Marinobacter subterrani]|uniref:Helix-turn-helix domain n=2 Tax=Marinobacter subterrani TaxID=1658765 RepID=A0A0J7JA04_9GAMM|nr:Helix-turn-helix domain [Marinobacter subterrani]
MARNRVTQRQLAEHLKVTQGLIYQWLSGHRKVSAEKVLSVCEATDWQITPHELRPDIYPNQTDGIPIELSADFWDRRRAERRAAERRDGERRDHERRGPDSPVDHGPEDAA